MADQTKIEWTNATWNPITGCSVVSAGCTNCYAMRLAGTCLRHHPSRKDLTILRGGNHVWNGEVRFNEYWLDQPLKWSDPRMIFVCAHGDLFHEAVPFEWIDQVFAVMALCPQHTFQVLTKRPMRVLEYFGTKETGDGTTAQARVWSLLEDPGTFVDEQCALVKYWQQRSVDVATNVNQWPLPNVWIGVSIEHQQAAHDRIGPLMMIPAEKRFLSIEPLLEEVDLDDIRPVSEFSYQDRDPFPLQGFAVRAAARHYADSENADRIYMPKLDWVIVGGESGPKHRTFDPDWARLIRDQCKDHNIPFFMKQMGGRTKKECQDIPKDLMIRQFPLD